MSILPINWYIPTKPFPFCFTDHRKRWERHNQYDETEVWCPICEHLFFWGKLKQTRICE